MEMTTLISNISEIISFLDTDTKIINEKDHHYIHRFQSLKKVASVEQYQTLLKQQESEVRNKVVELEIKANVESPDIDKGLRMQVQLTQLQNKFGRSSDIKETGSYARGFELAFLCFGPLDLGVREELERRVEKAVSKLEGF